MAQSATTPADLIIESIAHHPGCGLDDLVTFCPALTWNQIFSEVDRLSRKGVLKLALVGPGRYALVVPTEGTFRASQSGKGSVRPPVPAQPPQDRHDTQCERCGGLMVSEDCDDFNGWRCILCGERVDPVILAQRRKAESPCRRTVQPSR